MARMVLLALRQQMNFNFYLSIEASVLLGRAFGHLHHQHGTQLNLHQNTGKPEEGGFRQHPTEILTASMRQHAGSN